MHRRSAHQHGRLLEQSVARLFSSHGYTVVRNACETGRSGARYEIDVLAREDDGLLARTVAVECKNWAAPVDGQVVARCAVMRDDLAIDRVILVCPAGAAPAARQVAQNRAVTIWDQPELARRLGEHMVDELTRRTEHHTAEGTPRRVGGDAAARIVRSRARGFRGALTERVGTVGDAWLAVHELEVELVVPTGRRGTLAAARRWISFDALTGIALDSAEAPAPTETVATPEPVLPIAVDSASIGRRLSDGVERVGDLTQPAARERHLARLAADLIPEDATRVTVVGSRLRLLPVTVAELTRRNASRIVALDGGSGRLDAALGQRLTERAAAVSAALGWSESPLAANYES